VIGGQSTGFEDLFPRSTKTRRWMLAEQAEICYNRLLEPDFSRKNTVRRRGASGFARYQAAKY